MHEWVNVDGQVIQPISIGLFFARVLRGSHITMEQTRVDGMIWAPGSRRPIARGGRD